MAAKVSFVALAVLSACMLANSYDYSTTVVTVTSSLPYYPVDTPAYNDLKRSLNVLNQAVGSVNFNAQSYYDYYHLYKYNNAIYHPNINIVTSKLASAEDYLNASYNDYLRALNAYKTSLNVVPAPQTTTYVTDKVAVNPTVVVT